MSSNFLNVVIRLLFLSTVFRKVYASPSENAEVVTTPSEKWSDLKGHLQPFGESGSRLQIEERAEFPKPAEFLINYVQRSKPLKLSGVTRNSRAVRVWTDEYLLALDVPRDSVVQLETKKKENRQQETTEMHFHQFLGLYNQTEYYMVDDVPMYLRPDITVPCSLQCKELKEKGLAFAMMWFSSGGTRSVVHTDAFDNINCLIRGQKTFVMVDPARDRSKIPLRTEGAYSDIDVDSVDLNKYPDVGKVEFYHVSLTAGDCLYIPYKWIHQVRSYNSNIAVNFWWDHYATVGLLQQPYSVCQEGCNHSLTLDQVDVTGGDSFMESYENMRDLFDELTVAGPATEHYLADMIKEEFPSEAKDIAREFFIKLDLNKDSVFTKEEHAEIPVETWKEMQEHLASLMNTPKARTEMEEGAEKTRDEL